MKPPRDSWALCDFAKKGFPGFKLRGVERGRGRGGGKKAATSKAKTAYGRFTVHSALLRFSNVPLECDSTSRNTITTRLPWYIEGHQLQQSRLADGKWEKECFFLQEERSQMTLRSSLSIKCIVWGPKRLSSSSCLSVLFGEWANYGFV